MKIAILGAGISGLVAGRLLLEKGHDVVLFEKEKQAGGLCRTNCSGGFVHDVGGGHVLHSPKRELLDLLLEWTGPENVLSHARTTKIVYAGKYIKYPFENGLVDLPPEDRFECLKDYIDAHYHRAYVRPPFPETFLSWCRYRFGNGITDKFMEPYNKKIWKIPLDELGSLWVGGRVPDAPLEDVLRATLGIATEGYKHQAVFQYPAVGGFQFFTDSICNPIRKHVRFSTPVEKIEELGGVLAVNGEAFDRIISTIPIQQIVFMLNNVPDEVRNLAIECRYLSVLTILIGCRGEPKHPFSWVYLPSPEHGPANRVTYLSRYSPANSPEGTHSVLAEVTFLPGQEPDHSSCMAATIEGLNHAGIIDDSAVFYAATAILDFAYHVMDVGFEERREQLLQYLSNRSITSLGRFGALQYVNVDHAIENAIQCVSALIK
jgi:protoporphyrinogen oxidase